MQVECSTNQFHNPRYTGYITVLSLAKRMQVDLRRVHPYQSCVDMDVVHRKTKNRKLWSKVKIVEVLSGEWVILDGHHTVAAAIANGYSRLTCTVYREIINNHLKGDDEHTHEW